MEEDYHVAREKDESREKQTASSPQVCTESDGKDEDAKLIYGWEWFDLDDDSDSEWEFFDADDQDPAMLAECSVDGMESFSAANTKLPAEMTQLSNQFLSEQSENRTPASYAGGNKRITEKTLLASINAVSSQRENSGISDSENDSVTGMVCDKDGKPIEDEDELVRLTDAMCDTEKDGSENERDNREEQKEEKEVEGNQKRREESAQKEEEGGKKRNQEEENDESGIVKDNDRDEQVEQEVDNHNREEGSAQKEEEKEENRKQEEENGSDINTDNNRDEQKEEKEVEGNQKRKEESAQNDETKEEKRGQEEENESGIDKDNNREDQEEDKDVGDRPNRRKECGQKEEEEADKQRQEEENILENEKDNRDEQTEKKEGGSSQNKQVKSAQKGKDEEEEEKGRQEEVNGSKNERDNTRDEQTGDKEGGSSQDKDAESAQKEKEEETRRQDEENALTRDELQKRLQGAWKLKKEGECAYKRRRYRQAQELSTQALQLCPLKCVHLRAALLNLRATCCLQEGDYERTVEDSSKAIEMNPEYVWAYGRRAHAYENLNKPDLALKDRQRADELSYVEDDEGELEIRKQEEEDALTEDELQKRLQTAETLMEEGKRAFQRGQNGRAKELYTQALQLCPLKYAHQRAVMLSGRATCRIKEKCYGAAVKDCNKSIELYPEYIWAYFRRADAFEKLKKYEGAIEDHQKVLELDPNQVTSTRAITRLKQKIQEKNERIVAETLDRLKGLGNLLLRPFGLTTDDIHFSAESVQVKLGPHAGSSYIEVLTKKPSKKQ